MTTNNAKDQAAAQLASIAAMLAAAECDFDRMQELRDERQTLTDELEAAIEAVHYHHDDEEPEAVISAYDNPEAIAELAEYIRCRDELAAWVDDNAAELLELEEAAGEYDSQDEAEQAIQDDPLSVEVRSGWMTPGEELTPSEFCILLCTGGPAVRIVGELDDNGEPSRAWMEYQDWGTPWTEYVEAGSTTLLDYARRFYFAA